MSEVDPNLPEVPHEGPPYQGYGPAPYQPPAPVPPPVPPGYGMPVERPVPYHQPPPQPLQMESPRPRSGASSSDGELLQKWGYVMAISTLIMPILALVGLILGIITRTKPGRERHGTWIIGISVGLGLLTVLVWAALAEN